MSWPAPSIEDCETQLDRAMDGRIGQRAGWGGVVLETAGEHRDHLRILGFGRAVSMFVRAAVARGLPVIEHGERESFDGSGENFGSRSGSGYGFGDGTSTSDEDGNGKGYGTGEGYGTSTGSGSGYRPRYSFDGQGSGSGDDSGDGSGDGTGEGSGGYFDEDGTGEGSGDDDLDGFGYGDGSIYIVKDTDMANTRSIDKSNPKLIRHQQAGVYVGYLQGPGEIPGTIRLWARHSWNWRERLGTTAVAHAGPGPGSSLGPWVMIDLPIEGLIAAIEATSECMAVVEDLDNMPVALERMA